MPQDTYAREPSVAGWLQLIRAEYREIPGLHLTQRQVERLWGLDRVTTAGLLRVLVGSGFLQCTRIGGYVLADDVR